MLVTAIMPTRGRAEMSRRCLAAWRAQTWTDTELVIADDSADPSFPDGLKDSRVKYIRVGPNPIGAIRNLTCAAASGEFVIHFDSDDHYAPGRMADQVTQLIESAKSVTSYRNIRFADGTRTWINRNWPGGYGSSLCYRRSWWEYHPFPSNGTEDWPFVAAAMRVNEYVAGEAEEFMLCMNHPGNSEMRVIGAGWEEISYTLQATSLI